MSIHSYKDLIVWQRSIELIIAIYELTEKFPKEEIYGLTSQMRRAAVSIPSNIAEGRLRGTKKDFLQSKTKNLDYLKTDSLLEEIMKMLNAMIRNLNPKS